MPLSGRYRAVVFDMDGLLLDTETLWHETEIELFRRHGDEFTWDDKLAVIGTSYAETSRYFAERLGRPPADGAALVDEMVDLMHERLQGEVQARPGALELLRRLRALPSRVGLGLASNSSRRLVEAAIATTGLGDMFDAVVSSDDVAHPKPAPDIYLEACRLMGVAPGDTLALEDSSTGIAAAKAAGLTCIAVPQYAETNVSAADDVIDSLEALLET